MTDDPKTLVSTSWLAQHLKDPDLRVLDASLYLPGVERDAKAEYDAKHIPGARFFDIDDISDARSDQPHMAPPVEKFMSRLRAMGVGDGHQVVVYDGAGLFSAARVWWLFRLMGQMNIAVLDGGLPKWIAEGREVEDMPPVIRDRHMTVRFQNHLVRDVTQVASASKLGTTQIVDARAAARFRGEAPEPAPGPALWPYTGGRAACPTPACSMRTKTMKAPEDNPCHFRSGRRGFEQTDYHQLWLGRDRLCSCAGPHPFGPRQLVPLRWILGRMGNVPHRTRRNRRRISDV